jgi:hypothetical protein
MKISYLLQISLLAGGLAAALLSSACSNNDKKEDPTPKPDTVCFQRDVLPIFRANCGVAGCHNSAAATKGYVFEDHATITSRGVAPGNSANSKIYQVLIETDAAKRMPPFGPLSATNLELVKKWIDQGALDTKCN